MEINFTNFKGVRKLAIALDDIGHISIEKAEAVFPLTFSGSVNPVLAMKAKAFLKKLSDALPGIE